MRGWLWPQYEQNLAILLEVSLVFACVFCSSPLVTSVILTVATFVRYAVCNHSLWQLSLALIGGVMAVLGPGDAGWIGGALVCGIAVAAQIMFPIPMVRRKTRTPIGRSSWKMDDRCGRDNTLFDEKDKRGRRIVCSLFYPCLVPSAGGGKMAELYDEFSKVGDALIQVLPAVPNFMRVFSKHVNGPSSAWLNAPIAGKRLPLVILLHGITGPRWQYVSLAERLAEDGFLVAAIEHPFDTACCLCYDDGSGPVLYALGRPPTDRPSETATEWHRWHRFLKERVLDTHMVLVPWLHEKFDAEEIIDWSRGVGLVGHSFGGAEALELCHHYPGDEGFLFSFSSLFPTPPCRNLFARYCSRPLDVPFK